MPIQIDALEPENAGSKITELRALLAAKFPQPAAKSSGAISVPVGGATTPEMELQRGLVTEISGSLGTSALFVQRLLHSVVRSGGMMALVDGASAFDPAQCGASAFSSLTRAADSSCAGGEGSSGHAFREDGRKDVRHDAAAVLKRLLWVLCKDPLGAIKAADLLLRDGNLPLVVLDLQMNSAVELRRIPSTTWYRFQRILEQSTVAFVVMTPQPMVSSAAERFSFSQSWTLAAMRERRDNLQLIWKQTRRRIEAADSTEVALRIA